MLNLVKLAAIAATGLFPAMSAWAVPFQNGSFETGPNPGGFSTLAAGNTNITGWTVGGVNIDYIGTHWQPADGSRSIDLNGGGAGSIFQTFDTIIGANYQVIFALAGNPDGGPAIKTGTVSAANSTQNFSFDVTGDSRSNMGWVDTTFHFQAVAASTTLTFASTITGFFGPALDNVRVNVRVDAVPEPITLSLLGAGLAGIGLVRRRRA